MLTAGWTGGVKRWCEGAKGFVMEMGNQGVVGEGGAAVQWIFFLTKYFFLFSKG